MTDAEAQSQGRKLLTAVERIIASTDSLIALSQEHLRLAREQQLDGEDATLAAAAESVISHFSRRTAIAGGLASAPSLVPGLGTLVASVGGTLADMALGLKFEVEMALVLSHLHGFDISRPEERQLAFLMASVGTYDTRTGSNFLADIARAQGVAMWNYTPREVSKLLVNVLAGLVLFKLSKGLLMRVLPVVSVAVSFTVNRTLTRRVGARCLGDLQARRVILAEREARSRKGEAPPASAEPQAKAEPRKAPRAKKGTQARRTRKAH
ncbi:hypothetical protein [Hyalangium gracile]|uniref:hypothetical protein n=1 Tax=Hyalangium gracile TaxID=394092 RepID=UPI001CCD1CF2|nr:hypothetical protein [Hyalangium gracile]